MAQHEGIDPFFLEVFNLEKFKRLDIYKYDGIGCPKTHLQLCFSNDDYGEYLHLLKKYFSKINKCLKIF